MSPLFLSLSLSLSDAILSTRFDSVSNVLSDSTWTDTQTDPFQSIKKPLFSQSLNSGLQKNGRNDTKNDTNNGKYEMKIDKSRRPMIAVMAMNTKSPLSLSDSRISIDNRADLTENSNNFKNSISDRQALKSQNNKLKFEEENALMKSENLSIKNVEYNDVNPESDNKMSGTGTGGRTLDQDSMCFGCWSSGKKN